ncbi:MAG: BBE domain-containing protein [Anaerolineae bacterium]
MAPNEATTRTRDAYMPGTFERLVALKAKYDPDNLFRYSFSIPVSEALSNEADKLDQPADVCGLGNSPLEAAGVFSDTPPRLRLAPAALPA